jgi:prepilin peptidase CpaA
VSEFTTIALVLVAGSAAWSDLRTRRIPNTVTVGGLLLALGLRAAAGWAPLLDGLEGAGLALLLTVPFFVLGALGGGDTKLLAAIGAFMGPAKFVGCMLLIALLGGAIALGDAVRRGVLIPVMLNCVTILRQWGTLGRSGQARTIATPDALTIPYGVAIAAGAVVWWFWGGAVL